MGKAAQTLAARLYAVAAEQGDHHAAYAYGQLLRQGGMSSLVMISDGSCSAPAVLCWQEMQFLAI